MKIVGCDLHARQQSVAILDTVTGEITEKTLRHEGNAVREFYAALQDPVIVGIEATGHTLQAIALNHALRRGSALWSQAGKAAVPKSQSRLRPVCAMSYKLSCERSNLHLHSIVQPSKWRSESGKT